MKQLLHIRILLPVFILTGVGLPLGAQQADSLRLDLEGTVLTAERRTGAISAAASGTTKLELDRLEAVPRIFGSSDPLRIAQSLPGVSTNSEIDGGIHILGCESQHNLIRIGAAPIYGSNHLFGIFSPFIPSHFATMEISTDAPLRNRLGGEVFMDTPDTVRTARPYLSGDAGLFFSQGTVDVPLSRHSSLRLSGRASYLNALYGNYLKIGSEDLKYGFADFNLSWTFSKSKNRILKTDVYYGSDKAAIDAQSYNVPLSFGWSNLAVSQRFINTVLGEQALYFSNYSSLIDTGVSEGLGRVDHAMYTLGYRGHLNVHKSDNDLALIGLEGMLHRFGTDCSSGKPSLEAILFQSWTHRWGDFSLDVKLTESVFSAIKHKTEFDVSPVLGLSWDFHRFGRLALSAGRKTQNIGRTGVSEIGFPTEQFVCSVWDFPLQHSEFVSLDYSTGFRDGRYSFSAKAYWKKLDGQLVFKGTLTDYFGSGSVLTPEYVSVSDGVNYGLTLLLVRNSGRLTGWAGYSFGRSLMSGNIPSSHERIHELDVVLNYEGGRWDCGANFVLAGGTPFTAPENYFIISGLPAANYGEVNSSRLPAYSRLDLSFNWYFLKDSGRTFGANVSVYNALCYDNVLSYRLDVVDDKLVYAPLSFAMKFMPSVSLFYRFK